MGALETEQEIDERNQEDRDYDGDDANEGGVPVTDNEALRFRRNIFALVKTDRQDSVLRGDVADPDLGLADY